MMYFLYTFPVFQFSFFHSFGQSNLARSVTDACASELGTWISRLVRFLPAEVSFSLTRGRKVTLLTFLCSFNKIANNICSWHLLRNRKAASYFYDHFNNTSSNYIAKFQDVLHFFKNRIFV